MMKKQFAPNSYRTALSEGRRAIGFNVQFGSPEIVEAAGIVGYDYVLIDAEHGTLDLTLIASMIRAADAVGVASIVRVPDLTPSFISRVLDAGAKGILAPHVKTRADAEALVRASTYGPSGVRGACPAIRATGHSALAGDWAAFVKHSDEDTIVWALIEDAEGVENIEAIVSVPGLDAVMFGPFDLSQALGRGIGYAGDSVLTVSDVQAEQDRVVAAAAKAGIDVVGLSADKSSGARVHLGATDRLALVSAMTNELAALR